jgi:glycosyl transferase, family 25
MILTDIVSRIYVLNLPERKDRKKEIEHALKKIDIYWQGNQVICWPAIRPHSSNNFPSVGAYGCFLSHVAALQDACRAEHGWALILEDDAVFVSDFNAQLPDLAKVISNEQADLIYLGHCHVASKTAAQAGLNISTAPVIGAQGYIVRIAYLATLLPYLEACISRPAGHPLGGRLHYDGALSLFRQFNPSCRTWIAQPSWIQQRFSRSDIQAHWWYDRWPLVRQCAAWARKLKQAWRHAATLN